MPRHIYIHIPFCEAKCPYCDFYSVACPDLIRKYFEAASKEAGAYGDLLRTKGGIAPEDHSSPHSCYPGEIDTVYIGGGTPSFPDASYVASLLSKVRSCFDIGEESEITIEANPHSVTLEKMMIYKECGINRISLGVQSLQDNVLLTLGRLHDRKEALRAVDEAVSVFKNVSCDLMLGIPGQTLKMLTDDADTLISRGVKHISMYSLTLAEGTLFHKRYKDTLEDLVPDERLMYHGLRSRLESLGAVPYEISNCAFKGYESRHNMCYWQGREYYAIGPSSHGYLNGRRFSHPSSVKSYIEDPLYTDTEEELNEEERMREYAMLMLRTSEGVDRKLFEDLFKISLDDVYALQIKDNISKGYLEDTGEAIRLTDKGLDFANHVFADFL